MNLLLFEPGELMADGRARLPRSDPRALHLLDVLRRAPGDEFDAGIIDQRRGKGVLATIAEDVVTLAFTWTTEPLPTDPLRALVGLPRPQTARKLLQETTALGVAGLDFFGAERGEPNYAQSPLWTSGEWRRHLVAGAAQAFDTRIPEVTHAPSLAAALTSASVAAARTRVALDVYEGELPLGLVPLAGPTLLAFGPERGWSAAERDQLRAAGFTVAHLGARVLRVETAVVAAIAVVKSRLALQ